ncbi:MAG: helix-turn-helix domain-containing protein [Clostridia bacterium]|nr:helix-turn-helix domain-containing protein [Clostridia bacterium]
MEYFPKNLKDIRKSHSMTQSDLAKLLGRQKSTVSNYEIGYSTPSYETLQKLSEIFNVSIDELTNPPVPLKENGIDENNRIEMPLVSSKNGVKEDGSFSIPIEIMGDGNFFVMKLEDNSLSASNLNKGDFVLFNYACNIKNGDLVVVMLADNSKLVRYIYIQDDTVTLVASEKTAPLVCPLSDVTIMGKVEKALVGIDN